MENVFDIALVFSPHEWVEALHRHCTNTGDLRIRSLIYDPSVLQTETFDACVISDSHPALSSGLVRALHDSGHAVLGVCDDSEQARSFLASVNVDGVFSARLPAVELSAHIQGFLASTWRPPEETSQRDYFATQEHEVLSNPRSNGHGVSIGVLGSGGVGTTEISLVLASRMIDSVVVDADFEHPSIAPRTGLEMNPHIIDALEAAHNDNFECSKQSQRLKNCAAIVGVSHASFARDIRDYEIDSLCSALGAAFNNTIYDLGRLSEDSSFSAYTNKFIGNCDAIVIACEPTPVGVLRILEIVAQLHTTFSEATLSPIAVVVNKCTKTPALKKDMERELLSIEHVSHTTFLTYSDEIIVNGWRSAVTQPRTWKKPMNALIEFLGKITVATVLDYPSNDNKGEYESELDHVKQASA